MKPPQAAITDSLIKHSLLMAITIFISLHIPCAFASGSISGKVTLQSRTNHSSPITFKLNNPGETTPFKTYNITTASDGSYSLTDIPAGIYNLTAKALNSLSQTQVLIEVLDGQTASDTNFRLLGGDANNDNSVATADFGILRKAWFSNPASPNWDPRADFNGDGSVAVRDLIILRINWLKNGSEPQITITSPQDNTFTSTPTISISGTFSSVSRIVAVIVRGTSAALTSGAFHIDNVFLSEGKNKISAIAINKYNNKSADLITVTLDTTAPTGTIDINDSAQYTNSTAVSLNLSATDSISGLSLMQFSNDNINWSVPQGYSTSRSWELTPNDGTKTVYAKFEDAAGNWSVPVSNTITLDTTAPLIAVTSPQDGFVSTVQTITVSGTVDDSYADVTVNGITATVIPAEAGIQATFSSEVLLAEGLNTIIVSSIDSAGNHSSYSMAVTYKPDTVPPPAGEPIAVFSSPYSSQVVTENTLKIGGRFDAGITAITVNGQPCTLDASTGTFTGPMLISPGEARRKNITSDSPGYIIMSVDPVTHSGKNTLKAVITNSFGRTSEESLAFYYYQLFVKSEGQNIKNGSLYSQWQSWNLDLFGDCPFGSSWTDPDKESRISDPRGSYYQNNDNPASMVFSGLYTYAYIYRNGTDSKGNNWTDEQDATTDLTFHSLPLTEDKPTPMVLLLKGIGFTTPPPAVDTSQVTVNGQPLKELRLNSRIWPYNIYYTVLNEYEPDKDYSLTVENVPVQTVLNGEVSGFEFSRMSLITGDILLDSNNDGLLGGEDNAVEKISPGCVFWVNGDDDYDESTVHPDDYDAVNGSGSDSSDESINGIRDLEDFMPIDITIPNIKEWFNNQDIKFHLKAEGDGKIRIFKRVADNDEEGTKTYLVDLEKSKQQYTQKPIPYDKDNSNQITLDPSLFNSEGSFYGIFEGVTAGTLKLTLYVGLNNGVDKVVLDEAVITLKDVKSMFKVYNTRYTFVVGNQEGPTDQGDGLLRYKVIREQEGYGTSFPKDPKRIIVWTHGYNNTAQQSLDNMAIIFKRLYITGFRGGFIGVVWRTHQFPDGDPLSFIDFNADWLFSYQSGHVFADIIRNAKASYPDAKLDLFVHSLGNNVACYALKLLSENNETIVDNFILHEAAVPGEVFSGEYGTIKHGTDSTIIYGLPVLVDVRTDFFDNIYAGSLNAVKGKVYNTFSPKDRVVKVAFKENNRNLKLPTPLDDNYKFINVKNIGDIAKPLYVLPDLSNYEGLGCAEAKTIYNNKIKSKDQFNNKEKRPSGIKDHGSQREEYYYDVARFFERVNDLNKMDTDTEY